MQDWQSELTALREELASSYDASDLEAASLEDLRDMKAWDELDDFLSDEIDNFNETNIRNKDQLLKHIEETRAKYQAEAVSGKKEHTAAFYETLDRLLEKFRFKVRCTKLPDPLNDWWSYSYEITDRGINLLMNFFKWTHDYGSSYDCSRQEAFVLLEVPARLLTVSEYAKTYGVEAVTVRQWIRRARIRSVIKAGREWRIPELTEAPRERGYCPCEYRWSEDLTDLPEKYSFLSSFTGIRISQDNKVKNRFHVEFRSDRYMWILDDDKTVRILSKYPDLSVTEDGVLILTAKEREEMELYLIGNPLIRCVNSFSRMDALSYSSLNMDEFGNSYGDSGFSITFAED